MSLSLLTRYGLTQATAAPPAYDYGIASLDATPGTLASRTEQAGHVIIPSPGRTCVGLRVYAASAGADEVLRLWNRDTSALVDSVTVTPVVGEWVIGLFAAPVALTSGTRYLPTMRRADGSSRSIASIAATSITFATGFSYGSVIAFNNTDAYPGVSVSGTIYGLMDLVLEP